MWGRRVFTQIDFVKSKNKIWVILFTAAVPVFNPLCETLRFASCLFKAPPPLSSDISHKTKTFDSFKQYSSILYIVNI